VIRLFNSGIQPGAGAVNQSFDMIDRWLARVESDPSATPLEQKIINNRPADVHDVCFNNNGATAANVDVSQEVPLTDPACTVGPVAIAMRSPRIVSGGPLAENVFKCQLKPLSFLDADYNGASFDSGQRARLAAVFPNGVCDWTLLRRKRPASQPPFERIPGMSGMTAFLDWLKARTQNSSARRSSSDRYSNDYSYSSSSGGSSSNGSGWSISNWFSSDNSSSSSDNCSSDNSSSSSDSCSSDSGGSDSSGGD
jgi:hypothetical protein